MHLHQTSSLYLKRLFRPHSSSELWTRTVPLARGLYVAWIHVPLSNRAGSFSISYQVPKYWTKQATIKCDDMLKNNLTHLKERFSNLFHHIHLVKSLQKSLGKEKPFQIKTKRVVGQTFCPFYSKTNNIFFKL